MYTHIRYNPATDWRANFAQGLQNMLGGIDKRQERKRQAGDVRDVINYANSGFEGPAPELKTELGNQIMAQLAPTILRAQQQGIGTLPGWWPQATTEQRQNYINRAGSPLVNIQTGQELLTPEQRQQIAKKQFEKQTMPEPLSDTELTKASETIAKSISRARKSFLGRPGRTDYPKKALLREWNIYKKTKGYSELPENQKQQIWEVFKDNLRVVGGDDMHEADFDPTDPDWIEASELGGQPALSSTLRLRPEGSEVEGRTAGVSAEMGEVTAAGSKGLESIWPQMNDEEKQTAQMAIEQGLEASEIIDYFNRNR